MNAGATTIGRQVAVPDAGVVRAISFQAGTIDEIGRQVAGWLTEHPSARFISFSHAAETQYIVPFPSKASGPQRRIVYTGILLAHV